MLRLALDVNRVSKSISQKIWVLHIWDSWYCERAPGNSRSWNYSRSSGTDSQQLSCQCRQIHQSPSCAGWRGINHSKKIWSTHTGSINIVKCDELEVWGFQKQFQLSSNRILLLLLLPCKDHQEVNKQTFQEGQNFKISRVVRIEVALLLHQTGQIFELKF